MAGFKNSEVIRIIPDQPGRGGAKTSLSSQSINLDIRLAECVNVYYGRWRKNARAIVPEAYQTISDVDKSLALHDYTFFDTANATLAPTDLLLSHNLMNGGDNEIDLHNDGSTVKSHTPATVNDCVPATFLNINNRCFICWGGTDNFIYDGVHKVVYDVGIDPPATAATYTFGDTDSGLAGAAAGSSRVNWVTSTLSGFSNDDKAIFLDGQLYQTLQPNPLVTSFAAPGTITGTAGLSTFTVVGGLWPLPMDYIGMLVQLDPGGGSQETHYILSYTHSGANTVVITDTPLANNQGPGGTYTLDGIGNSQLILATPFTGTTSAAIPFTVFFGVLSWIGRPGPQYAYAYYDDPGFNEGGLASGDPGIDDHLLTVAGALWGPTRYVGCTITLLPSGDSYTIGSYTQSGSDTLVTTVEVLTAVYASVAYTLSGTLAAYGTGHVSNISPKTFVTEQDQSNVTVVLSNIIPSGTDDQARFNKILIFRTVLVTGPGALFPLDFSIGTIDNVGTAPLTFTDRFDDSFLLQAGGFQAPLTSNTEPPPFAHQAYWDGRIWGNPVDDPSAIVFSGNAVQILFGVAEESYPSVNILRIPSDDGRVTGMALMGPLVIIATERYAYYVVGGPDYDTYRLRRFSTTMNGVGDYQMIEFAGQTTDDSDSMIYLGKDNRFYLTAPSVGNIPVSDPVQDIFNNGIGQFYYTMRVANIAINGNQYLLSTLFGGNSGVMMYDWNRKIWTQNIPQKPDSDDVLVPQAFATIYGSSQPVQFLFIVKGTVYEWLGPNNTIGVRPPSSPFVETMPLLAHKKSQQQLNFIRIYVSDAPTEPWQALIQVDERGPGILVPFVQYQDSHLTIQPPGCNPVDAPNARELIYNVMSSPTNQMQGYRVQVRIIWPDNVGIQDLYAIDISRTTIEPPDETTI